MMMPHRAENRRAIIHTAFTSEKQPDSFKAKGFNERTFVIKCSAGSPEYDISEVISPAGDEDYRLLLDELVDIRKLLLVYRLLRYNDPIPDIKGLSLKNRDKQLCKPLIRLFQDTSTKTRKEILESLTRLLREKNERKAATLEARLHSIIAGLIKNVKQESLDKDKVVLISANIWEAVIGPNGIEGAPVTGKSQTWETVEYDTLSQKSIVPILRDRFGGDKKKDPSSGLMGLSFSRKKLERLSMNYSIISEIKIKIVPTRTNAEGSGLTKPDDVSGASGASTDNGTFYESPKTMENSSNYDTAFKNIQGNGEDTENIISHRQWDTF